MRTHYLERRKKRIIHHNFLLFLYLISVLKNNWYATVFPSMNRGDGTDTAVALVALRKRTVQ